jgi:hypothetical protein
MGPIVEFAATGKIFDRIKTENPQALSPDSCPDRPEGLRVRVIRRVT